MDKAGRGGGREEGDFAAHLAQYRHHPLGRQNRRWSVPPPILSCLLPFSGPTWVQESGPLGKGGVVRPGRIRRPRTCYSIASSGSVFSLLICPPMKRPLPRSRSASARE